MTDERSPGCLGHGDLLLGTLAPLLERLEGTLLRHALALEGDLELLKPGVKKINEFSNDF